ncbi:methyltransferase [Photorhabdus namnaonensis]|uniref:Multifunctional cyclase-dehydratase-3-O-methyl transferase TcmN n=1 Tax=Photorhabdus namnaonensis TaxID=1851568 RepID=A0A1B8YN08_9GAMM|nr:methyltransferase [Photorhabdus namnaonensis]OCA56538.1 Multifunctional cyclase-dehydratase-3-O-methyl transferase TcmN [Photorhabdus namnaonensis]
MLINLITSYRKTAAIYTFVEAGLSIHFKNGTYVDINKLADQYGIDYSRLNRLCDFLTEIGVLVGGNGGFALSDECSALADPDSLEFLTIKYEINPGHWDAWLMYPKSLLENNGKSAFEMVYGKPFFELWDSDKELKSNFDALMSKYTNRIIEELLVIYDFNKYNRILDLGGGDGELLIRVSEKFKGKDYAVLDRYNEIPIYEGIDFINGDFFEPIPSDYDLYILKNVLHNWPDNEAISLLKNCRKVMDDNANLLIITLMKKTKSPMVKSVDLLMDVLYLGKERYLSEFEHLADQAGLVVRYSKDIDGMFSLIELGVK